ncbi:MAG: dephospho-CoA kinase [Paracoccaceae bacterium]
MRRPFVIGLTGSIGMGKTTTADMFAAEGVLVWDADAAVHRLYSAGGAAVESIERLHPAAVVDEAVSRPALKKWMAEDRLALARVENVVHPLVAADRGEFLEKSDAPIVILDIPLLFETGAGEDMDMVVVVSAPTDVQRSRVLGRAGMTETQLDAILSKQMPDAEKRARADVVIPTESLAEARAAVHELVLRIRRQLGDA